MQKGWKRRTLTLRQPSCLQGHRKVLFPQIKREKWWVADQWVPEGSIKFTYGLEAYTILYTNRNKLELGFCRKGKHLINWPYLFRLSFWVRKSVFIQLLLSLAEELLHWIRAFKANLSIYLQTTSPNDSLLLNYEIHFVWELKYINLYDKSHQSEVPGHLS